MNDKQLSVLKGIIHPPPHPKKKDWQHLLTLMLFQTRMILLSPEEHKEDILKNFMKLFIRLNFVFNAFDLTPSNMEKWQIFDRQTVDVRGSNCNLLQSN